jgi:hypothetical protein
MTVRGVNINAYVDDTGDIEFWLLDSAADLTKPIALLGTASVSGLQSPIDVRVDTDDLNPARPDGRTDRVTLVD